MPAGDPEFLYVSGQNRAGSSALLANFEALSAEAVASEACTLDIAYGNAERQSFDFFAARGQPRATVLFFQATGMVRNNPTALAAAEAMQAAEILFATVIGVLWLGEDWPQGRAMVGALMVIAGIVAFSIVAARAAAGDKRATQELRSDRGA